MAEDSDGLVKEYALRWQQSVGQWYGGWIILLAFKLSVVPKLDWPRNPGAKKAEQSGWLAQKLRAVL
jgi:hypothetical protein